MIEVYPNKAIYIIDNQVLGKIDYPSVNNDIVNITHTFVDPILRKQGIADKLMTEVFKYLKSKNIKVICTCSYAKHWIEKHPEYYDLLTKA